MERYDFEAHVYIPEFTGKFDAEKIRKQNENLPPEQQFMVLDEILEIGDQRVSVMKKYGVDLQILSFSSGIADLPADQAIPLCRMVNDRMFEATVKYPSSFRAFAQLPEQDPEAACEELERCMTELNFLGWNTFSNYGEKHLDDEEFFPILAKAEELGAVVYLHPALPVCDPRFQGGGTQLLGALGYTLDTTITITRMMCSGMFDKLPKLKLILGHLGEGMPFYLDRIDSKTPTVESRFPAVNKQPFRYYFEHNIWVTNSGNFSVPAFECTKSSLGIDRILFGSDYPYESLEEATEFTDSLPLTEEERVALYSGNAISLFGALR